MSEKAEKNRNNDWLTIRRTLAKCSQNDLLGLIAELYSFSKANKNFLDARFLKNEIALDHYKKLIDKHLTSDGKISLKDAKKAISDYKKATNDKIGVIDLMVYYVQTGTDYIVKYGDMYEQYYDSLESVFADVIKLMSKCPKDQVLAFVKRLQDIVEDSKDVGWGYHDTIADMFYEYYYENFDDEEDEETEDEAKKSEHIEA